MTPHAEGQYLEFLINPAAGRGKTARLLKEVYGRLRAAGAPFHVSSTRGAGHATEIASGLPPGTRAVVAVGGDGTVRETAQGLLQREIPLAVLPGGTENLVAKQFGYRPSAECLIETLDSGTECLIDVGWVGERIFLIVGGVGFDAEVVRRLARARGGNITHVDYFWPLWRTFWRHRFPNLRVRIQDRMVFCGRGLVLVGNLPRYGLGLRICGQAVSDDGLLDVCVFPCRSRIGLLWHAMLTVLRVHRVFGRAIYAQGSEIDIDADQDVPVQLDGDDAGDVPAHFRIQPKALRLLTPPSGR